MAIPVLDLNDPSRGTTPSAALVDAIDAACREWGFFQVVNHGVSTPLIDRVWTETHAFFALPRSAKRAVARTKDNPRGYYDRELTKNARDLKEVFDFAGVPYPDLSEDHERNRAAVDGINRWPADLPAFRYTLTEYFGACVGLGHFLLEAICLGLGAPGDALLAGFGAEHTSFVRLNYYPLGDPLEPDEARETTPLGDMALHHHTDAGALTILLQDAVGGLQVHTAAGWIDVDPHPGALVINVGDMVQVWSNDRYRAALHRVLPRTDRARYSLPFFFNPSYDTDYAPLVTDRANPPRYRPINWGVFRQARTDGDYADYGKEIQIADFRTTQTISDGSAEVS